MKTLKVEDVIIFRNTNYGSLNGRPGMIKAVYPSVNGSQFNYGVEFVESNNKVMRMACSAAELQIVS